MMITKLYLYCNYLLLQHLRKHELSTATREYHPLETVIPETTQTEALVPTQVTSALKQSMPGKN